MQAQPYMWPSAPALHAGMAFKRAKSLHCMLVLSGDRLQAKVAHIASSQLQQALSESMWQMNKLW